MDNEFELNYKLYDPQPITTLIRWLQQRIKDGDDMVHFDTEYDYGGDVHKLKTTPA